MRKLIILIVLALAGIASAQFGGGAGFSGGGGSTSSPRMVLPDTIFVAEGIEFNAWYSAIGQEMHGHAPYSYSVSSSVGGVFPRSYRWTPSAAQTTSATFTARDHGGNAIESDSVILSTAPDNAGSGTKNVLLVGDSFIANTTSIPGDLLALFTAGGGGAIDLIGTLGSSPNEHEAVSGEGFDYFAGASSPFWDSGNSRLDFQKYVTDNTLSAPDFVVVALGVNDAFNAGSADMTASEIAAVVANAAALADTLANATYGYPDAKMLLVLQPPSALDLSAFGDNYNSNGSVALDQWVYYQRNVNALHRALLAEFDGGSRASVDVCAARLWVDREYGYNSTTAAVSGYDATTETVWDNYLHPEADGYDQMSAAIYSHLRHLMDVPATNLLAQSEDFSTVWTNTGPAVQGSNITDPDGGATGQVWASADGAATYFSVNTGVPVAADNVFSVFINYEGTTANCRIAMNPVSGGNKYIDINVTSATTMSLAWGNPWPPDDWGFSVEANGWMRVWFYADGTGSSGNITTAIYVDRNAAAGSYNLGVWGAQLEQGVTTPGAYSAVP